MSTSLRARIIRAWLRHSVKARSAELEGIDAGVVRASRERLDSLARFVRPPRGTRVEPLRGAGAAGEWLIPARAEAVGLYLHGGAYAVGSPRLYRALAGRLAAESRSRVLVARYRLAPEHPFPAALEDAHAAWEALVAGAGSGVPSWLAGDSAGGGLALALAQRLAAGGGPRPGALALISPWTDLTASGASVVENAAHDHYLVAHLLAPAARNYLHGADPADPRASPLFGSMAGLPPLRLHACRTELLRDDATRLAARVRAACGEVSLRMFPDLPHVFHAFHPWLPEAGPALADLASHLRAGHRVAAGRPVQ